MKINKNKITALIIATLLTLSIAGSIILLPNANAHTPTWNIPTYAYINAAPNPDRRRPIIIVYMWLDCCLRSSRRINAASEPTVATASAALISNNYDSTTISSPLLPTKRLPTTTDFRNHLRHNFIQSMQLHSFSQLAHTLSTSLFQDKSTEQTATATLDHRLLTTLICRVQHQQPLLCNKTNPCINK